MKKPVQVCRNALYKAHCILRSLGGAGASEVHGSHVVDISTRGDEAVSKGVTDFLKRKKIPAVLYTEEAGKIVLAKNPQYTIVLDEIDGTDNYHRSRTLLPHCTAITVFDSTEPAFQDALAAGIIEHISGTLWHACRGEGCYVDGARIKTSGKSVLDRRTLVIIGHYLSSMDIRRFLQVYPESWVKDFGSPAFHLAGVGSGLFDAYLSSSQKPYELGAGYLMVKEAGGSVTDFEGRDIGKKGCGFKERYQIVAASTEELGRKIISKIS